MPRSGDQALGVARAIEKVEWIDKEGRTCCAAESFLWGAENREGDGIERTG